MGPTGKPETGVMWNGYRSKGPKGLRAATKSLETDLGQVLPQSLRLAP